MALRSLTEWLRSYQPGDFRERLTDVNDGIIATSGTALGLAGAEVSAHTTHLVIILSATAGCLSMFAVKLGETLADREADLAAAAAELRHLQLTPEDEIAELADWFEARGVSAGTARKVAEELSSGDALRAQLELEYGIRELPSRGQAWIEATLAALAFLLGAGLPLLITVLAQTQWRTEWTLGVAAVSLTVTSLLLSRRGHSNVRWTVVRSLLIGMITLGITYLLGDLLV